MGIWSDGRDFNKIQDFSNCHWMFLSMFRMVIFPGLTLWFLVFYLNSSFSIIFWGLIIINWIFGIFLLFFTKLFIKKQFTEIKIQEQIT